MKKLLTILAALLTALAVQAQTGTPNTAWYTTNPDAPTFTIGSADELAGLALLVKGANGQAANSFAGKTITLSADINLSAYGETYNGGMGWIAIGDTLTRPFKGTLDGNGKKITGLFINAAINSYYKGLFGYTNGATVKSLGVVGAYVKGYYRTGSLVGQAEGATTIQDCYATGVVSGYDYTGGLVGLLDGSLQRCYSTCAVSGGRTGAGGISGYLDEGSTIESCYATGAVSGGNHVGGIVGLVWSGRSTTPTTKLMSCAALNPSVSITATTNQRIGRVYGSLSTTYGTNYTISGNRDFSQMTGGAGTGSSITVAAIYADGTLGGLFTLANGWTTENGKLPGFGAAVEMPLHLMAAQNGHPFSGGEGTSASPYIIKTAEELAWLAGAVNGTITSGIYAYSKYYRLNNDIDLSAYASSYNDGKGWIPIGSNSTKDFNGSFDGNGKKITGLYINNPALDYVGLFGYISNGSVQQLGVVVAGIAGKNYVGGVAGDIKYASVQRCYVMGATDISLIQGGENVGGVAGRSSYAGISGCYAAIAVSGAKNVGGVAGYFHGNSSSEKLIGCAALNSKVAGTTAVGRVAGSYAINSFALATSYACMGMLNGSDEVGWYDQGNSNGTPLFSEDIMADGTLGELFTEENGWAVENGKLPGFGEPHAMPAYIANAPVLHPFDGGRGKAGNPYLIGTAAQLARLAEEVSKGASDYIGARYKLTADIDLADYGEAYNGGRGWTSIGSDSHPFWGAFDGSGYTITGLYINNWELDYQGLFGRISGGAVSNLSIAEADIYGNDYVGGVAASLSNGGSITGCSVSGAVRAGNGHAGGVAGEIYNGSSVTRSYATATVRGSYAGGVAGYVTESSVTDCYATGAVSGSQNAGGVTGFSYYGTLTRCYATGAVSGFYAGGVAGRISGGKIENCAALNSKVSGSSSAGLAGRVAGTTTSTLNNNAAWKDMPLTLKNGEEEAALPATPDAAGRDGADMGAVAIGTDGTLGSRFTDGNGWTIANGYLPGLGAPVAIPEYLKKVAVTLTPPAGIAYGDELADPQAESEGGTDFTYRYVGNGYDAYEKPANAGTYTLIATLVNSIFAGSDTAELTIAKRRLQIDVANSIIAPKTYDGTFTAEVTHVAFTNLVGDETLAMGEDYTVVSAVFNNPDVSGAYNVLVKVALVPGGATTKNYELLETAFYKDATIAKATPDMSGVTFKDKTVTYNGEAHSILINGTLPAGVSVLEYLNNGKTDAGTYTVTVRFAVADVDNYNVPADMTATLTIEEAPCIPGTPAKPGDPVIVVQIWDDVLSVVNNPTHNGGYTFVSYQWQQNGIDLPGETGGNLYLANYPNANAAEYSVRLVTVGGEELETCPESIKAQPATQQLRVYPNPAKETITVVIARSEVRATWQSPTIEIYSMMGVLMRQHPAGESETTIDVSALPFGIYILRAGSETINFIKE